VRMMGERRAPGVQHEGGANACPQVLAIGGNRKQCLGGDVEQHAVDECFVLVRERSDRRWQGEHEVVGLDRQQIGLPRFKPALGGTRLALRAMAVAAGVVGDLIAAAAIAAQYVPTQCRASALFDGRHDLELSQTQVALLSSAPSWAVSTEDVGDLQGGTPHEGALRRGQHLERRNHFAQDLGANLRIECRRLQLLVPEQDLDDADVNFLLEQVSRERMA